jgi:hypothetical protein
MLVKVLVHPPRKRMLSARHYPYQQSDQRCAALISFHRELFGACFARSVLPAFAQCCLEYTHVLSPAVPSSARGGLRRGIPQPLIFRSSYQL